MFSNTITHDPYAYLGRALMGDPIDRYVPKDKMGTAGEETAADSGFGEDGFGFDDFLDIINPLQHIPGLSTFYRELTGDEISPGSRMIGGALFGGPIGFVASLINSAVEDATGRDVGEHMVALFSDDATETAPDAAVMIAETPADAASAANVAMEGAVAPTGAILPATSFGDGAGQPFVAPFISPAALKLPERAENAAATAAEASAQDAARRAVASGLEWKGEAPPILQQVTQASAQELTEEQLHLLFQSFRAQAGASDAAPVSAGVGSAAYQQRTDAMQRSAPARTGISR